MASTSTSNSHSTSTLVSPSTTTTSCSSSSLHCTPTNDCSAAPPNAPAAVAAATLQQQQQRTTLAQPEHCSTSPSHNETETETRVEQGKSSREESTSPLPLTNSSKDKADNCPIKTRKKRKKNNSSCRIIRAGEDADYDSCTFSSSSCASDNEGVSVEKKRFLRKRENRRKSSPGRLSPFEFRDNLLLSSGEYGQKNRKLEPVELPRMISERRLSRRKTLFFNQFPDLLSNSNSVEKVAHVPTVNLMHTDKYDLNLVDVPLACAAGGGDERKRRVERKRDRQQFIDEQLSQESNETTVSPSEMFSTHYNLRWKNHQNHMLLAFESLLYNESFVDVSLVCSCDDDDYEEEEAEEEAKKKIKELNKLDHDEANDVGGKVRNEVNANQNNEQGDGSGGRCTRSRPETNHKNESVVTIKAHKIVLSASSEFFQRIFAENPCKHPVVILTSFQRWEVQALVDFMYRGEVDVSSERLSSIVKTAASLQIRGLADYAGKFDTINNKHEESIEPQSPLLHQLNLNTSISCKQPPQLVMNAETMESIRRGLDRELLREQHNSSVDNDEEEDHHLEMMRIRKEQERSLSPKLLNLSMGSSSSSGGGGSSGHTQAHLSSKIESTGSTKLNFQRDEPQATILQNRPAEPFPPTNHHHNQKQLRHNQMILNNNSGNANEFLHHYGGGSVAANNHNNTPPMLIPRRKQARPRRRSADFVAVAQDLRKGNAHQPPPAPLDNHEHSPPPPSQESHSSSQTPTTPSSSLIAQNLSCNLSQTFNQIHHNNNRQHRNSHHHNHTSRPSQSLGHQAPSSHHRRSSRHHRRSHSSSHNNNNNSLRPVNIPIPPEDIMDDHEADDMDENQVLDYTTTATGAGHNNNSLIAAGLHHPHSVLAMKHWISSTPTPPLNQRNSKAEGESDDGLTPPPEQCHTPSISPSDAKGFPVDFPLFGMGDHPHLHCNRNLTLSAFKTSPPSPSSFFLSSFNSTNGPISMSMLTHSDESNNAAESASTPPNVFSPAGFPMPLSLPLTTSNNNNHSSHSGPPGSVGNNSVHGQRSSPVPVGWPGLPLGPAPIFGRHRAQHSAPRGGPPRAWSNADLTEALHNVWNKKMTTSQASRIFGIPYNSLLMYVRGKYGKSLKLDLLKKGLDLALENKANSNKAAAEAKEKEANNSTTNHNHSNTVNINNNNNNTNNNNSSSGKSSSRLSNSNNSSPSSQNINNNNPKSKSHHSQPHHHPHHHHHHSQHSHHHHHQPGAGGSPPLGIGNIGLVGLGEPSDIPAGFNPFTAAASIFGDYPAPFPFASALSHILPPGSLITTDKVALNDDDK